MLGSLSKVEYRQLLAIPYLLLVLGVAFTGRTSPWDDLGGMLGLCLVFVPAMLVPRRWLWIAFLFAAAYFMFFGTSSLLMAWSYRSWMAALLPVAFLVAALLFIFCAVKSKRSLAAKS